MLLPHLPCLQALDDVSNAIIAAGHASGITGDNHTNPTSITHQLEVLCSATAAAASLTAAAALQQLQDLQQLLLPGRQRSNLGQSQGQGGGQVPGGQLLVELLGGVTSGLALVPNLLQVRRGCHPAVTTRCLPCLSTQAACAQPSPG
jgi:hypothetical protein